MALKNLKNYESSTARNVGITTTDQVQLVTRAADPTDSTLANGRFIYKTGVGFRGYAEGAWFTVPTSTTGGSAGSWETLYTSDKTLTIDSTTLTFAGTHATNAVLTITGAGTGAALQITNSSTGADVSGTSAAWSVSAAGAAVFTAVTGCNTLTAAGNLAINATGAGTISLGATSTGAITLTRAVTATTSITITGSADTTVLTVSAGDVSVAAGLLTLDDDDTATGNLSIPSSTATSGDVISVVANALTSGAGLKISSTNGASFSSNGGYIHISDGSNPVFTMGRYGATVIVGNAATNVFTITAGNEVITAGNLTLTSGNLVMTSGSFTYTAGDMTMSDGQLAITDADDNNTLAVVNNAGIGTNAAVVSFASTGTYVGTTTKSFLTITPSGLTTGTAVYIPVALITTGKAIDIAAVATQTTGILLNVQDTGANCAITSGKAASFDLTATAITGTVNKTESGVSITSSRTTTTGTVSDNWDLLSVVRTDIGNLSGAGAMTAAGAVLYVENAVTNTAGTVTDTAKGIEVVMDSLGTGAGVNITHAATGGVALNIVGAATSVSDVLITGSGVKATGKGTLEVTNSGATAAGGAVLKVGYSGTPAAATSYLANFDYTGGTNSTSIAVIIQSEGTGTPLLVTTSGAAADGVLQLVSTETGTTGVVLKTVHTSTGSAAANDIVCSFQMWGLDNGDAVEEYGRIEAKALTVTGGAEASAMQFYVTVNGTSETSLVLKTDYAIVGAGTANAYVTSSGAYDLILNTNEGTTSGTITIADAANGDITIAPNGTGQSIFYAPTWVVTNKAAAATLTVAEGGVITCDTTSGAFSLVLPAATGSTGLWYTFKKTDSNANAVTIDGNASETIDGALTHTTMDAQYDTITIVCNGTAWFIVSQKIA